MNQLKFRLSAANVLPDEIIVDIFAGGGGASHGIEIALGRSPDIAINHDPDAIEMHTANHPATRHFQEDVWKVRIKDLVGGRPVGLLWASPDCRHFSRAKGGKPVSKRVRSLATVVIKYARDVRPRVICLENVPEFLTWGPLGKDAMPIKARAGEYFEDWAAGLRRLGYVIDKKILNAADFGAPTSRKRIFVVARRDGMPIVWPEPSHGPGRPLPYRTAAECIDWAIPCPSIFDRKKPLADATLRRIARGIVRYVLQDPKPFIVNLTHGGRLEDAGQPMRTVTGAHRGEKAVVAPILAGCGGRAGQSEPRSAGGQMYTMTRKADTALVTAFLAKHYGGVVGQAMEKPLGTVTKVDHHSPVAVSLVKHYGQGTGARADEPAPTITAGGMGHIGVQAVHLTKLYGTATGATVEKPMPTSTSGGQHLGMVAAHLTKFRENSTGQSPAAPIQTITGGGGGAGGHFGLVYAFLVKYFGNSIGQSVLDPLHTITRKDREAVVTVTIGGEEYAIADIGMRMLQPHELAMAQGFPADYRLTGTKTVQVAKIGNSVCPPVAAALVRANLAKTQQPLEAIA